MPRGPSLIAIGGHEAFEEGHSLRRLEAVAFGTEINVKRLTRLQLQTVGGRAGDQFGGRRFKTQFGASRRAVEALISKRTPPPPQAPTRANGRAAGAAARALRTDRRSHCQTKGLK